MHNPGIALIPFSRELEAAMSVSLTIYIATIVGLGKQSCAVIKRLPARLRGSNGTGDQVEGPSDVVEAYHFAGGGSRDRPRDAGGLSRRPARIHSRRRKDTGRG